MGSAAAAAFRPPGPPWGGLWLVLYLWAAACGLAILTGISLAAVGL